MLSDTEILRRLIASDIIISPMISAPEQIGPSSIDVHLGTDFLVVERSDRVQFDALMTEEEYREWLVHVKSTSRYSVLEQFILHPGEFALGATLEFISLPNTIVAHIDGRSSWARRSRRGPRWGRRLPARAARSGAWRAARSRRDRSRSGRTSPGLGTP